MVRLIRIATFAAGTFTAFASWAGAPPTGGTVPEPGTLALVALAVGIGYAVTRKRK